MQTANRRLMWYGVFLFLVGLVTGTQERRFTNMRMALSAHLEGVMNGTFLIAFRMIALRPTSVKEVTTHVVGHVIDQLGIEHPLIKRWKEDQHPIPVNGDRQLAEADDRTTRLDDKPYRPHRR